MDEFDNSDVHALAIEMANLKLELEQTKKRLADLERDFDRAGWNVASQLREHELILRHLGNTSK